MRYIIIFLSLILYGFNLMAYSEQTLVFIRHGEKPNNDSGQLSCQGLNRALALPNNLIVFEETITYNKIKKLKDR